ncbi:MAG: Na+/H+ antiporter NhaC family protein [Brumimicrobium sp.]|nr:Na+/H+ antiporter NhaC family protein [Brumimicrobium sp.]
MCSINKFLVSFLFFFSLFSLKAQEVVFPEVILKNVETEVKVFSQEPMEFMVLNGDTLMLNALEDHYATKVVLESDQLEFSNTEITFNKPIVIPGWLSLLPPVIAIALALIFKEVLSSLFIGVFIGAATIGFYTGGVSGIFGAFLAVLDHYILGALSNPDHLSVILFSVLIGSIVAIISKNGGMKGVVNRLVRFAQNRKSGMLTTYFLGIAIFFDDYANTLVVGNTMRPVTDKLRISREKLAYIVDSTAAPVAAIAFITTWIGAELTYISDGVEKIEAQGGVITESAYSIFVNSLAYSFYPIFTLFFMLFIIYKQRDFGPMFKAETKAREEGINEDSVTNKELEEFNPVNEHKIRAFNAIVPIAVLIIGTLVGLVYTGLQVTEQVLISQGADINGGVWNSMHALTGESMGFFRKLGIIIGNANSYAALLWASLTGLTVAIFLTVSQRIMSLKATMDAVLVGINTMMPAVVILVLAWSLAGVTESLNTAEYLKAFFGEDFSYVWVLPALTFVLSAFIAFSTGSSWSTMALMYPLVIPLAYGIASGDAGYNEMNILYNTIACVLAGAVLGDHCSPISDTTILSSLSTSCDHISHVRTQMPYALTVGATALLIGIIPGAMGVSSLITMPVGIVILFLITHFFGKKTA